MGHIFDLWGRSVPVGSVSRQRLAARDGEWNEKGLGNRGLFPGSDCGLGQIALAAAEAEAGEADADQG